jgi:hypothetical protein
VRIAVATFDGTLSMPTLARIAVRAADKRERNPSHRHLRGCELSCPTVTIYLALGAAVVVLVILAALRRVIIGALRSAAAHFWPH